MSKVPKGTGQGAPAPLALVQPKPAIQGPSENLDASPTRIGRMLRELFKKEQRIRAWEDQTKVKGTRYCMYEGKMQYVEVSKIIGDSLIEARRQRDEHVAEIEHLIDYALNVDAFDDKLCPDCRLPYKHTEFVEAVLEFERPPAICETCQGLGWVRVQKSGKRAKKRYEKIKHFKRVLEDTILCAKVRMGTSEANEAYQKLEDKNRNLLVKFGNEKQTSLEGADAEQGVRQGIVDAAMRYDPTDERMAQFNTVAYNWCHRNSRARRQGQKRAGVYAPSIDGMGGPNSEEGTILSTITSSDGALGTFEPAEIDDTQQLSLDVEAAIRQLPDDQQQVVKLQLQEKTTSQISEALGISRPHVRKLREAAFGQLRGLLAGYALNG